MHPAINWLVLQTAPHTLTLRAQNEEKECTLHVCITQQTLKIKSQMYIFQVNKRRAFCK